LTGFPRELLEAAGENGLRVLKRKGEMRNAKGERERDAIFLPGGEVAGGGRRGLSKGS